ncbi:dTDP-4-dehydrorhamnose 3,5-epimerase [Kineosporia mesophila]|uniref:dTDP-4-dehydrorhamnose 3,5-epimerase n=1 Tax=Kineosporia mesophila TaxID=566012 RepID=A0ABP6Z1H2_9ACTN|nr:dTDP-4-dehydrorhamnose 3,5-epimerase [Kineosporia mesophila]MCD5350959.1 dTDP-4-dehydrorhamnose 3,5-epimerase [Kineosporia mesophila]
MKVTELAIPDAYALHPRQFEDSRGVFMEWYRHEALTDIIGHRFELAQANCSVSRRGTLRGLHYANVPPGQAKYVTCVRGAILDVVVDIRLGSPTFGQWDAMRLDDVERAALYVGEGLAHSFVALTEDATVMYLCSTVYNPTGERGINPIDPALEITWPEDVPLLLSDKDREAPTLMQAKEAALLPDYDECRRYMDSLRAAADHVDLTAHRPSVRS